MFCAVLWIVAKRLGAAGVVAIGRGAALGLRMGVAMMLPKGDAGGDDVGDAVGLCDAAGALIWLAARCGVVVGEAVKRGVDTGFATGVGGALGGLIAGAFTTGVAIVRVLG